MTLLINNADVARVLMIELVGELGPRDADIAGVDDDDVVAQILVRRVGGLMFPLQAVRNFRGQAAQRFARGVNEVPVPARLFRLRKYGVHENLRSFGERRESLQNRGRRSQPRPHGRRAHNIMYAWRAEGTIFWTS